MLIGDLENNMKTTLTQKHPLWDEFCNRLYGKDGCNFQNDPEKGYTWKCSGNDKTYARKILESLPNIDVEATLKYFESNGGYCDCEILFNVDR